MNSSFPQNLTLATLADWMVYAVCLGFVWSLYRRNGFVEARTWVFLAVVALNPYLILFGTRMFSDVFFTVWVLATLAVLMRGGIRMAFFAGLLAGFAYFSRTAGLALLISVPSVLIWKREFKRAGVFAAAMLPFVIGWTLWTGAHMAHSHDATLMYYVDYSGFRALNFGMDNVAVIVWKNIDQVLYSMGSLVLPGIFSSLPMKILTQVIAFAMIVGTVRLVRRGVMLQYAAFALVSAGTLLVWHFPPTERFLLPIFPLLAAGLVTEMEHLWKMLRASFAHRDVSQRVVGGVIAAVAVLIFGSAAIVQGYVTFVYLHESTQQNRAKLRDLQTAYSWIESNVPASASILSYDDPLLYLYTGHRGNYLPLLSRWWYAEDHAAIAGAYRDVAEYCRYRGLSYLLFTSQDLSRETGEEDRAVVEKSIRENRELTLIYKTGIVSLYRVE